MKNRKLAAKCRRTTGLQRDRANAPQTKKKVRPKLKLFEGSVQTRPQGKRLSLGERQLQAAHEQIQRLRLAKWESDVENVVLHRMVEVLSKRKPSYDQPKR